MGDPKTGGPDPRRPAEPTRTIATGRRARDGPPEQPDASFPLEPPAFIGAYRVLGPLGEGGMAVVFEAEQQRPRRHVALKVVRGDIFLDEQQLRMFQREVEALARLKHPSIAAIYESGRTPGGRPFFAMELVRGETLHAYLQSRPRPDTRAELRHRLEMFREICQAVSYAHQRGVIHRDLKPSNVIVTGARDGGQPEIKILDFGLARLTDADLSASAMTQVGVIKGTLPYMSPEQIRGDPREIDVRSDVYSLGVILFEMLTGDRPYDTRDRSMIEAARVICEEPPRLLRRSWTGAWPLDDDLETLTGKALEKEPDRRYDSAAALSEDVTRYLDAQPILARPPSARYQLRKFVQRRPGIAWGLVVALVALVGGAVAAAVFAVHEARRSASLQRFAYRTLIQSSTEALEQGDRLRARELLLSERVPAELRGWEWELLWARSEPPGVTIAAPVASDSPATVELDGSEVVVLLDDTRYRFDAASGERLGSSSLGGRALAGLPRAPLWVEHGPGGFSAAVVDEDSRRRLYLFQPDGEPCGEIDDVPFAHFGPSGSHLLHFGQVGANRVVVWDLATCRERLSLAVDWWVSRTLSPDGERLSLFRRGSTASWGMTDVYATRTGQLLARFPVASASTVEAFTPDGVTLLSASEDGDLRVLRIHPPSDLPSLAAHDGRILALTVGAGGRWAATADERAVRLWDLETRERLAEYQVAGRTNLLRFSRDDRFLLRVADDNAVTILDTEERADPRRLTGHRSYVEAAAVHPDGELLATGDWVGVVLLWDAASGRQVARLDDLGSGIHALRFSPDGSRLIGVGTSLHVWDLATGALVASLEPRAPAVGFHTELPAAGTPLDADAGRILTGWRPDDASVEIWNVETGARTRRPLAGLDLAGEAWVSADGRFAVEARVGPDKPAFLEVRHVDGALHLRLPTAGAGGWPFALSRGSRQVLLAAPVAEESPDRESGAAVGLWELASGRKVGELRGHDREVMCLAFTPDGRRLVTGSRDGTLRVWDPETREEISRFKGHRLYLKHLAFAADGTRLVSTSGDRTALIWDGVSTNRRLRVRREQERDLEQARPLVTALAAELDDVAQLLERLRAEPGLTPGARREALREALRVAIDRRDAAQARDDVEQSFFLP
jgi:serine/threonine protein kinase/WD40 repeat protein